MKHGVARSEQPVDWARVRAGKDELVTALRTAKYEDVLRAYPEITSIEGRGVLDGEGRAHLSDGTPVPAERVVVTTATTRQTRG